MHKLNEINKIYGVGNRAKKIIYQKVGLNKRIFFIKTKKKIQKKVQEILSNFVIGHKLKEIQNQIKEYKKKNKKSTLINYEKNNKTKKKIRI